MLELKNIYKTFNPGTINEKRARTSTRTARAMRSI